MSESIKRMLINATQAEEIRVALINGQNLYSLDIETLAKEQHKSNIYKAKITRVERSLDAVFADFGVEKHGFLSGREISKEYFKKSNIEESTQTVEINPIYDETIAQANSPDSEGSTKTEFNKSSYYKLPIQELIQEGQELIVQVEKEQRGNKGAALTTFISLAGCYLVLMPNNPKAGGISKRIEGEERDQIKQILSNLNIPEKMSVIVRTAGFGRSLEELQWDLDVLLNQWKAIQEAAKSKPAPFLIYQESNLVIRCIRDHLRPDIEEILIDDPKVFDVVYEHMKLMRPDFLPRVKLYNDVIPLFSKFKIESQIESAYQREVKLKSGGSLVIDHTEALTSIDINSAKATKGADIEETALQTNLEAVEEISRQLRLRDLGGLIVIDFIDMNLNRNQREIEQRLRTAMSIDRAKVQMGKISKFGLLEMSRQRLRPALNESIEITCPRCNGKGTIRGIATMAINIIRLLEEKATDPNVGGIILELPIEIATFLINEKRNNIMHLEKKQQIKITIVPNKYINVPNYEIKALSKEELSRSHKQELDFSYNLISSNKEKAEYDPTIINNINNPTAAIISANPTTPAPAPTEAKYVKSTNLVKTSEPNIITRILKMLLGKKVESNEPPITKKYSNYKGRNYKYKSNGARKSNKNYKKNYNQAINKSNPSSPKKTHSTTPID